jgi:hypothetical protein
LSLMCKISSAGVFLSTIAASQRPFLFVSTINRTRYIPGVKKSNVYFPF